MLRQRVGCWPRICRKQRGSLWCGRSRYEVRTKPRARPQNVKEAVVERREFKNIRLIREEVAEFDYRPAACRKTYRMVVVKKYLETRKGQEVLFDDYRYFFYLTNDRESSASEIVYSKPMIVAIRRICTRN